MDTQPLSTLFELLPIGAYRTTPTGVQVRANPALVRLNGFATEAEMLGAIDDLENSWYVEPGRRTTFRSMIERDGVVTNFVSEVYRYKSRERIWIRENAHLVKSPDGQPLYYEGTVEDITESYRAQQALADSEARWRLALESAGDGVWDWHLPSHSEFASDRLKAMFGYAPDELDHADTTLDSLTHPDDLPSMTRTLEQHLQGLTPSYVHEHRIRCKDGSWKWVLSRGMVIERGALGEPTRVIGTHTDISEQKRAQEVIWQQANFDPLTGMPNRRRFRQLLDLALSQASRHRGTLALGFIDLDHFKEVNDSLGHDCGDLLLVEAARRIGDCTGPGCHVARMGGDEFAVLWPELPASPALYGSLQPRLARLLCVLTEPFVLQGQQVYVSASVGVVFFPDDAAAADDLLKHADQALYAAKGAGRNRYRFFSPDMELAAQTRASLDLDLRSALAARQLEVVYQPIVDLRSGAVYKAEALLRWHHPTRGSVSPAVFIPIAEATGQIVDIGRWVFHQAMEQAARLRATVDDRFQVSVNKSPVEFHQVIPVPNCMDMLAGRGLPGNCLTIEITEGLLLETNPAVTQHLTAMRDAGLDIALDDFGTGYSSLTYLQQLDIDCLKIDQSFVRNLEPGSTALTLCRAMIAMAHELGMVVVAEGVETQAQHDLLCAAGCDFGQGFLYAHPMSAATLDTWLAAKVAQQPLAAPKPELDAYMGI